MAIPILRGGQFKPLTDEDIKRIDSAVLRILTEVGVRIEYRPALEVLRDGGCAVDFDKHIVRIPEHVLRRALATAPSQFTLAGQKPEYDVFVDLERIYTIGGSSALYVLGLDGERRPSTLRDLIDLTRLQDTLENLHIMHAIAVPQDIPQLGFDRILFANVVPNTSRNYYSQGQGGKSIRDQVEMAAVILGSAEALKARPIFTIVVCMVSPLLHPGIRVEELMECTKWGIPVYIEVDAQMGATTPITVAGTLVEECANVLAGVTLVQMLVPGHPCIFAIASGTMDMSTANYYKLPFQGGTGIDAVLPDAQAGYERALQVLINALAGTNFIHLSIGMMEQMLTASYEQCLIDNEIIGAAFQITRGFEVNDDTIAFEVLKELGPANSQYMVHEHTVRHLRKVYWRPKLTNRDKWEPWMDRGGKDMRARAREQALKILDTYWPQYLSKEQVEEIRRIAQAAQGQAMREEPA